MTWQANPAAAAAAVAATAPLWSGAHPSIPSYNASTHPIGGLNPQSDKIHHTHTSNIHDTTTG